MNIQLLRALNRVLARLHPYLEGFYPYPLLLQIEPTSACNLRCLMCERSAFFPRTTSLSPETLEKIIGQFPRPVPFLPRPLVVNLTGLGENLLNPGFLDMLDYLHGEVAYVSFTSNFTIFDEEVGRRIIAAQVDSVIASVDGAEPETFEAVRVGASFSSVLCNLKALSRLRGEMGSRKPELTIRFVPSKPNIRELPRMPELARSLGVLEVRVPRFYASEEVGHLAPSKVEYDARVQEAFVRARVLGVRLIVDKPEKKKVADCLRSSISMYIASSGQVLPCCFILAMTSYDEALRRFSMGDVHSQSVKEIWTSPNYQRFRRAVRSGHVPQMCKLCPVYE